MQFIIKNKLEEIDKAAEAFDEFAQQNQLSSETTSKFQIAIDELLSNVISYGYPDDELHEISLEIILNGDTVQFITLDDGLEFNPLNQISPDTNLTLEDRNIGGLGIHIIKKMMDNVKYERESGKNKIII